MHRLQRHDARRIAVRAQLLDRRRPAGFIDVVRGLTALQLDPAAPIAPSADLVLWSRLGAGYSSAELEAALREHRVVDLGGMLRPAEDLSLYRAEMAQWPGVGEVRPYLRGQRDWVQANDACRRDLLRRLGAAGPMTSRELPDTCVQPWASSGWNNNRNVVMLLGFMAERGEVAVAGREGRDRLWDLASRVYPDTPAVPAAAAVHRRNEKRLRALSQPSGCCSVGPT